MKNLKKSVLIIGVTLLVYTCQKEKLNKKAPITFLAAGVRDSLNNVEIFSFDDKGSASKLWSYNLKLDNLDSLYSAVQIKTDQIVLFADSTGQHFKAPAYFGIFNKYSGKMVKNFTSAKNYKIISITGHPIYNTNDGNIYFWGYGKKSINNLFTNGIFKLNLSNDEISILDSNYFYSTLDSKNNILYASNGSNKILKLNLNSNAKEEFTISGNLDQIAFLHFDAGLNKLLLGRKYLLQDKLFEVDLTSKKYINLKANINYFNAQGNFVSLSDNQYSEFTSYIHTYNFQKEKHDSLPITGWNPSKFFLMNYFGPCK